MRKKLIILTLFVALLGVGVSAVTAQNTGTVIDKKSNVNNNPTSPLRPVYAPHKILVKFKPSLTYCPQSLLLKRNSMKSAGHILSAQSSQVFRNADKNKQTRLDSLIEKYQIKKIEPLYRSIRQAKGSTGKLNKSNGLITFAALEELEIKNIKALRNKFPKRAKMSSAETPAPGLSRVYVIEIGKGDVTQALKEFSADPAVESAQFDYLYKANWSPNDPLFNNTSMPNLWGLKKMKMETAWDINKGEGITVAVVDSGVDYLHFELNEDVNDNGVLDSGEDSNSNGVIDSNIWINADEIPNNGKDDDGNGYIDDVRGWNFSGEGNEKDPIDIVGHGTHVAGTIAALGNNNIGIVGVAPLTKIMVVKGLGVNGGSSEDLARAMEYAIFNGADVINNSWGPEFRQPENPRLEEVSKVAYDNGVVVVFAAGNSADDVKYYSPNNTGYVIHVAAFDSSDGPASFTNYGERIDVAAPGVGILSLNARVGNNLIAQERPDLVVQEHYLTLQGTSMAAPHVSGLVALILSHFKDKVAGVEDVRAQLCSGADFLSAVPATYQGSGRVNAQKSLTNPMGLRCQITKLIDGTELFPPVKSLTVVGSIGGVNFYSYRLYYASAQNPDSWTAFSDEIREAKTNQVLGELDLTGLPAKGDYLIKLVVRANSSEEISKILTYSFKDKIQRLTFSDQQKGYSNLVTDGEIIYFSRGDEIWKYTLVTGLEEKIKATGSNNISQLALAGCWVVYRNENNIAAYNLDSAETRQIASVGTITSWAAQGAYVAWTTSRTNSYYEPGDVYLYDFGTQQSARLTSAADSERVFEVKIDNGKVIWASQGSGVASVKMYDITKRNLSTVTPIFKNISNIAYKNGQLVVRYLDSTNINRFTLFDLGTATERDLPLGMLQYYSPCTPVVFFNHGLVVGTLDLNWGIVILYINLQTGENQVLRRPEGIWGISVKDDLLVWSEGAHPLFSTYPYAEMFAIDRSLSSWPVIESLQTQIAYAGEDWEYSVRVNDENPSLLTVSASLINGELLSSIGVIFQENTTQGSIFKMRPDFPTDAAYQIILTASNGSRAKKERFYLRVSSLKPVWTTSQITTGFLSTLSPQVSGNHLIWICGHEMASYYELYYLDLSQPEKGAKNLSMDPRLSFVDFHQIELSGDKLFYRNMAFDGRVMSYNLATQEVEDVSPVNIKPMAYFFHVCGDWVVWNERLTLFHGYNSDNIFLKNLSTGQRIQLTANNVAISQSEVEQAGLKWESVRTKLITNNWAEDIDSTSMRFVEDFDTVVYRLAEVFGADFLKIYTIITGKYPPAMNFGILGVPHISEDKVGWQDSNGDLMIYDITKKEQIRLPNSEYNFSRKWDISEGRIVWTTPEREVGEGKSLRWLRDIWILDLFTKSKTLVAQDAPSSFVFQFSISGNKLAWDSAIRIVNSCSHIFLYDISKQQTQRLSFENDYTFSPFLSGDTLVAASSNFYTTPTKDFQPYILFHKFPHPATTIAYSPVYTPGTWTRRPVTVSLTATDTGLGVRETKYSLDNGTTWQIYTVPLPFLQSGIYKLKYYSVDNGGNQENSKSVEIKIDLTRPVITPRLVVSPVPAYESLTISADITDVGSGVKQSPLFCWRKRSAMEMGINQNYAEITMTAQGQDTYQATISGGTLDRGKYSYYIAAQDNAGNWKATPVYSFEVSTPTFISRSGTISGRKIDSPPREAGPAKQSSARP